MSEENFNDLTAAETERFALLSEEAGEVNQGIGKILRHGLNSYHPETRIGNKDSLEKEIGDLIYAALLLSVSKNISIDEVVWCAYVKSQNVTEYLHHQPVPTLQMAETAAEKLHQMVTKGLPA